MWLQYLIEQNILPCNHLSAYQCVKIFHMFLVLSLLLQPPDDLSWSQTEFSWDGEDCWDDEVVEGLQPPATAARGTTGWYATAATGWASRTTWHPTESKMEGMVKSLKKVHILLFFDWLPVPSPLINHRVPSANTPDQASWAPSTVMGQPPTRVRGALSVTSSPSTPDGQYELVLVYFVQSYKVFNVSI